MRPTAFPVIDGIEISNWDRQLFEQLHAGGVSCVHATTAVWEDARRTLDRLITWDRLFRDHADLIMPATCSADVLAAHQQGRTAIMLGFQNTAPIEDDPGLIPIFHRLGVRIIQLTYNIQNLVGSACFDLDDGGLTRFGRTVITEMERVGILIDCSHVGNRTTREAIDAAQGPVAITHANPRWFCDSPRNKPDDVIDALASRGGVIGLTLYPNFIGGAQTSLEAFCAMAAKLVDRIGIEHVAIGSDLACGWADEDLVALRHGRTQPDAPAASWPRWQAWFHGPADFPRLVDGLAAAGFTDTELRAIMGANWMRLWDQTMKTPR